VHVHQIYSNNGGDIPYSERVWSISEAVCTFQGDFSSWGATTLAKAFREVSLLPGPLSVSNASGG